MSVNIGVNTILVAGPPRSGTTLLANLLSGASPHPLLPECQAITNLIRERLRSERELDETKFRVFLRDKKFADTIFRTAIESMLTDLLARLDFQGKFLVLKDPYLVQFLDQIDRLLSWPIRKVCILRDPRDAIASYINVGIRNGCRPHINEVIDFMAPFYPPLIAGHGDGEVITIRYEDLVRKDRTTQNRLSEYIGHPIDLDAYAGIPAGDLDPTDAWYTSLLGKGIGTDSIGIFEKVISPEEYHLINDTFPDVLSTFYSDIPMYPR